MEDREDFNLDALLEHAIEAVRQDSIPGDLPPERVGALIALVEQAASQPHPLTFFERIKSMKMTTRIAVGAAVMIAVVGLISWLSPHGGAGLAFADVAEVLASAQSATWKTTTEVKGPNNEAQTWSGVGMFLAPAHERTEISVQGRKSISIIDGREDKMITLDPAAKTAVVVNFKNRPAESPFGKTFQGLRDLAANAQNGKAGKTERLGAEMIDGRQAEGFRIRIGAIEVKVWADPKSLLPIRIEETATSPDVHIVMTDFQVGKDLDKSLFSLDVPSGYSLQQTTQMDLSKKPIAYLAEALKLAAECNDGVFPPALRGEQGIDGVIRRAGPTLAKKRHAADPAAAQKLVTEVAMTLGGSFGFLFALPPDSWHYAGKDVKINTPERPIFWYKLRSDAQCTVIYADLSIKQVPVEETPKMPEDTKGSKP